MQTQVGMIYQGAQKKHEGVWKCCSLIQIDKWGISHERCDEDAKQQRAVFL